MLLTAMVSSFWYGSSGANTRSTSLRHSAVYSRISCGAQQKGTRCQRCHLPRCSRPVTTTTSAAHAALGTPLETCACCGTVARRCVPAMRGGGSVSVSHEYSTFEYTHTFTPKT